MLKKKLIPLHLQWCTFNKHVLLCLSFYFVIYFDYTYLTRVNTASTHTQLYIQTLYNYLFLFFAFFTTLALFLMTINTQYINFHYLLKLLRHFYLLVLKKLYLGLRKASDFILLLATLLKICSV